MMGERSETDFLEQAAIRAWRRLGLRHVEPQHVEVLKHKKKKGSVYRLAGAGPHTCAVIAKRCRPERAAVELAVYEEILPQLSVATPHYYGSEEGDAGFWWIFLEDVGNQRYSPSQEEHRALAAQWLADMHVSAEPIRSVSALPDRGPGHYLAYLRSAVELIPRIREFPALDGRSRTVLNKILTLCHDLDGLWRQIETWCAGMPRTFVHGDCLVKNVHVRSTGSGLALAPFDWGGAGWGLPATDLGHLGLPYRSVRQSVPDFKTYAQAVQEQWSHLDLETVRKLANLGQIFWSLKVISRSLPSFENERAYHEGLTYNFDVYGRVMARAIGAIPWDQ